MLLLFHKELRLIRSLLLVNLLIVRVSLSNSFNLLVQFDDFITLFFVPGLQGFNLLFNVSLSVLSLQLLLHCKSDRALVQSLVCCNSHLNLISNSKEKKSTLWQIQSNLTNDFIETLSKELLSNWADSTLTSLSLHEFLVKHLSKSCYIDS